MFNKIAWSLKCLDIYIEFMLQFIINNNNNNNRINVVV